MQIAYDIASSEAAVGFASQPKETAFVREMYDKCPLCDGRESVAVKTVDCTGHPLWRAGFPHEMNWLQCTGCSHVYTDGHFRGAALRELLDKMQEDQAPGEDFERHRQLSAPTVERLIQHGASGTWLDVGCGSGALVATAQEYGFAAQGIDLRKYVVDVLIKLGIPAEHVEITDVVGTFDVISMCDVLEHTPWPTDELSEAHERLNRGGLILVSCPAYGSTAWRMLGDRNPYWWEIEHFHNFSRSRLEELLVETGFEPISYSVSQRYRAGMELVARKLD